MPMAAHPVAIRAARSLWRRIAVIHIDGNHDHDCCRRDCELWLTRLAPQVWLILDDYLWAHGDGPGSGTSC